MDRREFLILSGGMAAGIALVALAGPAQAQAELPTPGGRFVFQL